MQPCEDKMVQTIGWYNMGFCLNTILQKKKQSNKAGKQLREIWPMLHRE